jgi:hypothetical protein
VRTQQNCPTIDVWGLLLTHQSSIRTHDKQQECPPTDVWGLPVFGVCAGRDGCVPPSSYLALLSALTQGLPPGLEQELMQVRRGGARGTVSMGDGGAEAGERARACVCEGWWWKAEAGCEGGAEEVVAAGYTDCKTTEGRVGKLAANNSGGKGKQVVQLPTAPPCCCGVSPLTPPRYMACCMCSPPPPLTTHPPTLPLVGLQLFQQLAAL